METMMISILAGQKSHRETFALEAIRQGFKVWKDADVLNASKKNRDGITIKMQVSPMNHDFRDGNKNEPCVKVIEGGIVIGGNNWAFRLSTFEIHD